MKYSVEPIAAALKAARKQKRLSQKALSIKTGVPQSHISKIEKGTVDLRVSGLIEISRNLDLELMLVPRQWVPAFKALLLGTTKKTREQIPLYRLEQEKGEEDDV